MSFADICGQEAAVKRLKPLVTARRLPPAFLFFGPEGVGKAGTALQLAKALNCAAPPAAGDDCCDRCGSCMAADKGIDPDFKRVDAAYQASLLEEEPEKQRAIKVDTIRRVVKDMELKSMEGRWKTAVLEGAERLAEEAANALLKTLEEPPPRTLWVLLCSRREKLLPTILSRCQAVPFRALPPAEAEAVLAGRGVPKAEAARLAALAEGSPGRALALRARPRLEPASWLADPLAPFKLAESLPKELHLSRPLALDHLRAMSRHLRLERGIEGPGRAPVRRALRELAALQGALESNADPRLVATVAALELQRAS